MTTQRSQRYRLPGIVLTCSALLLSGCSGLGGGTSPGGHRIALVTEPPGATVYADGNEIGTTPLDFSPGEHFRAGFVGSENAIMGYRYIGKLAVKKPGCRDYLTEVDDSLLSKDIHVQLECDPDYRPAEPVNTRQPSATAQSAEQRLRRIRDLHDEGLLSDEEYRQLRQRVLDTL